MSCSPALRLDVASVRNRLLGLCGAILMLALVTGCGSGGGGSSSTAPVAHGLWVPNYKGNTVTEFTGSKLETSGTPSADLTNSSSHLNGPVGSTFDKNNNLWLSNYNNGTLVEYTLSQLKKLAGTPAPAAKVVISGLLCPAGVVFDGSGNLWVADFCKSDLVEFTPTQLAASGSPTPHITITSTSFVSPVFVGFDKSGNLWLADSLSTADSTGSAGEVFEFTPSQLSTGGLQTPNVSLATSTLNRPYAVAFDASGNMWVANNSNSNPGTLQEFAASDLSGSGVIQPAAMVTISATAVTTSTAIAQSLDGPTGLAFDSSGNLWVANGDSDNHGSLAEFTPGQLATSGSPSPNVFLDSDASGTNLNFPAHLIFGPSIK